MQRALSDKTLYQLGDQHGRIIDILWHNDGATVREVWQELGGDSALGYTSVLSAVQKLEAGTFDLIFFAHHHLLFCRELGA